VFEPAIEVDDEHERKAIVDELLEEDKEEDDAALEVLVADDELERLLDKALELETFEASETLEDVLLLVTAI
jgi:hypothetical protein